MRVSTFAIASSGTLSDGQAGKGSRLVGLVVPTMDSTTIEFEASLDGGTTYVSVHTNTGATAAVTLGNANTGAKVQAVPEDVGRISAVAKIRLKVASQTGGARSIGAIWEKLAEAA